MLSAGVSLAYASMIAMAALAILATGGAFADPEWYAEKRTSIFTAASWILFGWLVWGGGVTYRLLMAVNTDLTLHPDVPLSSLAGPLSSQARIWASLRTLIIVGLLVLVYLGILERARKPSTPAALPDWLRVARRVGHVALDGLLGWIVGGTLSTFGLLRDALSYEPAKPLQEFGWPVSRSVHDWQTLFPVVIGLAVVLVTLHVVARAHRHVEPAIAA
jgi:hypothetical protein